MLCPNQGPVDVILALVTLLGERGHLGRYAEVGVEGALENTKRRRAPRPRFAWTPR